MSARITNREIAELIVELYSGDEKDTPASIAKATRCDCDRWRTRAGCLHDRVKSAVRALLRRK